MHVRSASFNSAVLLAACGLLTAKRGNGDVAHKTVPSLKDDPLCSPSLGALPNLKNGLIAYPADQRWTNLTYSCICRKGDCINKCCSDDEILRSDEKDRFLCQKVSRDDKTSESATRTGTGMPELRLSANLLAKEIEHIGKLAEHFRLLQHFVECPNHTFTFSPHDYEQDFIILQANGSIMDDGGKLYPPWDYCIDWQSTDRIGVIVCLPNAQNASLSEEYTFYCVGTIVSIPFLVATFLVYAIIPELRNLYGKTLMCYVICLVIAYVFLILVTYIHLSLIPALCLFCAFIIHFSFLASFFWLNVMCFDIWWTFGGFRSLQGSVKQRERKKFVIYSIYAWGSASILTIVCAIMDFVPSVPKSLIRPEFGAERCWFSTEMAKALYFYGPMSVTVVCNICLFISTALKILRHKKDTAHHLRGSESRRHDDNKQWFSLYLKLFIVMGINWSMEIISWLFKGSTSQYLWYLTDLANTLQGLIIFIIFVWKGKIKRLLLKRFGCQDGNIFSRNSTRSGCHSTASRTCTTTSGVMPLQEKISSYPQTNCRAMKSSSDEAEP